MPRFRLAGSVAAAALVAGLTGGLAAPAFAGTLVINTNTSDPAPKAAFQAVIDQFQEEYPDITVEWNVFDHEGYKTAIRNFLTAEAPDIATWFAGNRMAPFVEAGLFEDVSDLWQENGLTESLSSTLPSMTIDDAQWGVPYTYYQWGVYYRKDIFADLGLEVPETWDELLEVSATLKENDVTPFTIGTKFLWTTAGWFDYLNLRVNGYDFHMDLANGEVPYTDERVVAVFDHWDELVEPGYFLENHAAYSWQEALSFMVQGNAAMYLMGNFAVAPLLEAGLTEDSLGFFAFPTIDPDVPRAEDAPTDTLHIPANASNKEDARTFLAFVARPDIQGMMNGMLGQLPVNRQADVPEDPYLQQGFELLSTASALAQFYDRDAPPEMAKAGMEGFQEYMVRPERREDILDRLESARQRIYD
ncbi:MAG: extracellular solute-binding protein [Alphaproteobacteria bacterium]|nr:extracellular solute-binding protein [Alphaproteobacteria bacterium]